MFKQGAERHQSRRIKEYNYKQRLDRRFVEQMKWTPDLGAFRYPDTHFNEAGEFLGVGSEERQKMTRDDYQAMILRSVNYEEGYSDRKRIIGEKVQSVDFKQQIDELFVLECEETYPNPDEDYLLGCNESDIDWVKRTYGYDIKH